MAEGDDVEPVALTEVGIIIETDIHAILNANREDPACCRRVNRGKEADLA